jgi:hypothetical protein
MRPVKSCLTCSHRHGPLPMTQPESAMHMLTPINRRTFLVIPSLMVSSLRRAPRLVYLQGAGTLLAS